MITLQVNAVDKTNQIDWQSLEKTEVLTKEPDSLRFSLRNYGAKTFRPQLDDEVTLFDGATKIFGGIVIDTHDIIVGNLKYFAVNCKDFTQTLDRQLVAKTYTGDTADTIIADIIAIFTTGGFTGANVVAPIVVEKIIFNYMTVSQALSKLATVLGNYDWYVDYDKDIHFFEDATISSPFNLTDTSANYVWNSLVVEENIHQLRNHIIIRGGDIEGDNVTNIQIADGVQRVFFVGYSLSLSSLLIEKALSATPTTFVVQTVGKDGVDNPASFDCLYNPNDGLIIFPDGSKPASNDRIKSSGLPIFPLIAEKIDVVSQGIHGDYQYLIVDKTIKSRDAASQRADAELTKYSTTAQHSSFKTYTDGLRTGQTINIGSIIRNFSQDFRIERIITTLHTPTTFQYEVSALASEDVTMVDVLNRLMVTNVNEEIAVAENEVVDRLFSAFETINLGEAFVIAKSGDALHFPQTETIVLSEVDILQPIDYATIFVYAPYLHVPSFNGADKKRVFIANGSPLG